MQLAGTLAATEYHELMPFQGMSPAYDAYG